MWPEVRIIAGMRRVDDDVARHVQVGDALVGVDHGQRGALRPAAASTAARIGLAVSAQRVGGAEQDAAEAVVGSSARGSRSASPCSAKSSGKNACDDVAEDDRVGDLHHGGLEVDREQHVVGLGPRRSARRGTRCSAATSMTVASTTSPASTGHRLLEHRDGAVVGDVLDAQRVVGLRSPTDFSLARKSPSLMCATLVLRVGAPGAHRVRVLAGVLLDRLGRAAVGVALAQDRVDGAALDLVVAGAGVLLLVGLRVVGVVGERRSPAPGARRWRPSAAGSRR